MYKVKLRSQGDAEVLRAIKVSHAPESRSAARELNAVRARHHMQYASITLLCCSCKESKTDAHTFCIFTEQGRLRKARTTTRPPCQCKYCALSSATTVMRVHVRYNPPFICAQSDDLLFMQLCWTPAKPGRLYAWQASTWHKLLIFATHLELPTGTLSLKICCCFAAALVRASNLQTLGQQR